MPNRKDLRVIPGGKADGVPSPCSPLPAESCAQFRRRADHYRSLVAATPNVEVSHLISDMIDAINALARLEESEAVNAPRQAIEYRRLIAELEIEIVSALER